MEIAFIQTFRSELESLITTLIQNPFDIYTNIESLYTKLVRSAELFNVEPKTILLSIYNKNTYGYDYIVYHLKNKKYYN